MRFHKSPYGKSGHSVHRPFVKIFAVRCAPGLLAGALTREAFIAGATDWTKAVKPVCTRTQDHFLLGEGGLPVYCFSLWIYRLLISYT